MATTTTTWAADVARPEPHIFIPMLITVEKMSLFSSDDISKEPNNRRNSTFLARKCFNEGRVWAGPILSSRALALSLAVAPANSYWREGKRRGAGALACKRSLARGPGIALARGARSLAALLAMAPRDDDDDDVGERSPGDASAWLGPEAPRRVAPATSARGPLRALFMDAEALPEEKKPFPTERD